MHIIRANVGTHNWKLQFSINLRGAVVDTYICLQCGMVAKKYGGERYFIDEKYEIEEVLNCENQEKKKIRRTK